MDLRILHSHLEALTVVDVLMHYVNLTLVSDEAAVCTLLIRSFRMCCALIYLVHRRAACAASDHMA